MPKGTPKEPKRYKKRTNQEKAEMLGLTLGQYEYRQYRQPDAAPQGTREYAEKMHRAICIICKADSQQPGFEQMVKELYMRWYSSSEIEKHFGYYTTSVVRERYNKKGEKIVESVMVDKANVPYQSVNTHARFFDWQTERGENTEAVLDVIIDNGLNNLIAHNKITEKALLSALDMKNKIRGNYYKPMKNPRDVKSQMEATVQVILDKHHKAGELDVSREDVIASLEKRPGFAHIRSVLGKD